jgi:hypothetical protein
MLFPLPEARFLGLDLLGEALAERLFFLLELRIVRLLDASLARLAGFHMFQTVVIVVLFLGSMNEVEHVGADEQGTELAEIAVGFALNYKDE